MACVVSKPISLSYTRPNIRLLVIVVSKFMSNPIKKNMEEVYHILKYLKMTLGSGHYFKKMQNKGIDVYLDANGADFIID